MARIEPMRVRVRGAHIWVRTALEGDAAAMLAHQEHMYDHNPFGVTERGERTRDEARQREWITQHLDGPGDLILLASEGEEVGSELCGAILFRCGERRKIAHQGTFGISVHADWRGRGVGTRLIEAMLDWAAASETIEKVCLGVFEPNHGARALYTRLGFVEEGRQAKMFKLGPGRYADDVSMAIFVKPGLAPEGYQTWKAGEERGSRMKDEGRRRV